MKRKWISCLLLVCICLTLAAPAAAEGGETGYTGGSFASEAGAALLIDLNTGITLYALNANEQNYPASLTKIMTCLLALENGNLDDTVTVTAACLEGLADMGNEATLLEGEEMPLRELLYCIMVKSINEACNVVAEYVSGSIPAFVELMNQRAKELGCTNTHFTNSHGLHDPDHYTTAYDLALITQEALKNETFQTLCNTVSYTLPATNLSEERTLTTTNDLINGSKANNSFYYSKAFGVKTGFTTPAQRCVISTADNGNLHLLAVVLHAANEETETGDYIFHSFPECIKLFEYGFNNFQIATVLTTLYPVAEIQVNQSAGSQTVALAPLQEIRTLVSADYDPNDLVLDIRLTADSVNAPVEAGDVLGQVTVSYQGQELGVCDLGAITSVARSEITHQVEETKVYVKDNWWKWLVGILIAIVVLIIACLILLQVYRRRERKRKVAARRRALEQQRRQRERQENWLHNNMEE